MPILKIDNISLNIEKLMAVSFVLPVWPNGQISSFIDSWIKQRYFSLMHHSKNTMKQDGKINGNFAQENGKGAGPTTAYKRALGL